jgi:hypothetical protein
MASSNNNINLNNLDVVELDYANLKASLKNFLKGQSQFKDYDYDGPNMATLLRLLAYNTYINAFYTNMALSEAHLDSAQLRSSILSHAKTLNYLPRSRRSSQATVSVTFEATGASQPYTIPKGSTFSAVVKNTSYTFSTPESIIISSANTTFNFTTDIYEGFFVQDSYILEGSDGETFRITNQNVDTSSLTVTVFEDGDSVGDVYVFRNTLLDLNEESKVFFLQTNENGFYEVVFGDNIIGRRPRVGSAITLDYRLAVGPDSDGAKAFGIDFDPTGTDELSSSPIVTTVSVSKNGSIEESDESIRYFAPRAFQVQERTVINSDYSVALRSAYPEINVVYAYGGEEADPPQMGKVFIAVDLTDIEGLPDSKVREYGNFLRRRSPFGIDPIFIEPDYLYLDIETLVRYNVNITTNSTERIATVVQNALVSYRDTFLDDFAVTARKSEITRTIDFADVSIVSNISDIRMYKRLQNIVYGVPSNYVIEFDIPIRDTLPKLEGSSHLPNREHAIGSDPFYVNGIEVKLEDTGTDTAGGTGIIRLVQRTNGLDVEVARVGTIDYSTGAIKLTNLNIQSFEGSFINIYAYPKDADITAAKNTILTIEPSNIDVSVEQIRIEE